MTQGNSNPTRFIRLIQRFDAACRLLRDSDERRNQKLVHWVLPKDRCVPGALLERTLGDLISTPFESFLQRRGFGGRKLETLVQLLERAARHDQLPDSLAHNMPVVGDSRTSGEPNNGQTANFDPAQTSEAVWKEWQATLGRHAIADEPLGRFARSLQDLPKVAWSQPLNVYLHRSLAEIRSLRAHGEKRMNAILGVFFTLQDCLKRFPEDYHLNIRLELPLIGAVDQWCQAALVKPASLGKADILARLGLPLMQQLEIDASPDVYLLASGRLGIDQEPKSVRRQALELGITRARVYQMFDEASRIMYVRWRAGDELLPILAKRLEQNGADRKATLFVERLRDLFYPDKATAPAARQRIQQTPPIDPNAHASLDCSLRTP